MYNRMMGGRNVLPEGEDFRNMNPEEDEMGSYDQRLQQYLAGDEPMMGGVPQDPAMMEDPEMQPMTPEEEAAAARPQMPRQKFPPMMRR